MQRNKAPTPGIRISEIGTRPSHGWDQTDDAVAEQTRIMAA